MITKYIPQGVTRSIGRTQLWAGANSPKILFGVGVVSVVGAAVLACKSTLHVEDVLNEHEKHAMNIKTVQHETYTDADRRQDMLTLYIQTTVKLTRLYAPPIIIGSFGIGCLTKSHNILSQRNAALSAAYAGLDSTFRNYRERVKKEIGEEKEKEVYLDAKKVELKNANGDKVKLKVATATGGSPYAVFYDETNRNFVKHAPEMNILVLRQRQNYLNDKLKMRGHLFLNEVYDELGFDHTTAGAVTGWLWDPEHQIDWGDGIQRNNFVDFGIWADERRDSLADMVVDGEGIFLDFNVDGEIYDKIDQVLPLWKYRDKVFNKRVHGQRLKGLE